LKRKKKKKREERRRGKRKWRRKREKEVKRGVDIYYSPVTRANRIEMMEMRERERETGRVVGSFSFEFF